VIEKAIAKRQGKIELAKVDVDANQTLARTYRIQSIPAVKAFKDGQPAAEFVGAQPPAMVEQFLDSLLPSEADALIAAGDEASLRRAVELEPSRADAAVPLARILYGRGELDDALKILAQVPGSFAADGLAARIGLERAVAAGGQTQIPGVAEGLAALDAGDHERSLDALLTALPNADGSKDDLRRVIVGILDELGVEHPLARESRRRLAAALY
jgi:putative thioredoxin